MINGEKRFISQGDVADLVAVFAVTDTDPAAVKAHRHVSCFYVEKGTPASPRPRVEHKMGIRGSTTAELAFADARVPDSNRVGELGDGWSLAMKTFERSRPGIGAQAVGIAQGALDVAQSTPQSVSSSVVPSATCRWSGDARRHGDADGGGAPAACTRPRSASTRVTRMRRAGRRWPSSSVATRRWP